MMHGKKYEDSLASCIISFILISVYLVSASEVYLSENDKGWLLFLVNITITMITIILQSRKTQCLIRYEIRILSIYAYFN